MADMSVLSLNIYTQLCYIHSKRVNVDTLPLTYLHQNSVSSVRFVLNVGTHILYLSTYVCHTANR